MKIRITLLIKIFSYTALVFVPTLPCLAVPNGDFFANNSLPMQGRRSHELPISNSSRNVQYQPNPAVSWFENLDDLTASLTLTDAELVTLKKPINGQAERFQQWDKTAKKAAYKFMCLAKKIRLLPPPGGFNGLKEYRDERADWYEDMATVYDDLTRPREPAKTYEELERALQEVQQRANSIAEVGKQLSHMEDNLRSKYDVHQAKQTDMLYQSVHKMEQASMRTLRR